MPNHGHSGSAKGDVNATMKTIMDQAITGDVIKGMTDHILIWEDEGPSSPQEAKDLGEKAGLAPGGSLTSESGDAVPQFQQVSVNLAQDSSGAVIYDATADADPAAVHDAAADAHVTDSTNIAVAHHADATVDVGEGAAV